MRSTDFDTEKMTMTGQDLPPAHPDFAAHFTDAVYSDLEGEFAPFGTDEGYDLLFEWADRRDELSADSTVADLIEDPDMAEAVAALDTREAPRIPVPGGQVDAATIAIGAGFTLLRLTGHIDEAGRQQTLAALDVLITRYGRPTELLQQRSDLNSWTG